MDASVFSVQPESVKLDIPAGETRAYNFTMKALRDTTTLAALPQLEFNVQSGGARRRFHREVRFLYETRTVYQTNALALDGLLADWGNVPSLTLGGGDKPEAVLRSCHDAQNLYLAVTVPKVDDEEVKEVGFSDELQIGFARALGESEFGGDQLRLGFNADTPEAKDRTPGRKVESLVSGTGCVCHSEGERTAFEIQLSLNLIKGVKPGEGGRLVLDLSFLLPEQEAEDSGKAEPNVNTFAYSVRYGDMLEF